MLIYRPMVTSYMYRTVRTFFSVYVYYACRNFKNFSNKASINNASMKAREHCII